MNNPAARRTKLALVFEPDAEIRARWVNALKRNQFEVPTFPPSTDPLFAVALMDAAGRAPAVVIAALSYFGGRNCNPYQFAKRFAVNFLKTSLLLVQLPGMEVNDAMRALARRYGAVDLAPADPPGAAAVALIETLRLSASVALPVSPSVVRQALALGIEQQAAVQLRPQLKVGANGAFRAADALARAEKLSISREQLTAWLNQLVQDGSLRSLSGNAQFVPGDDLYRFFTDEPAIDAGQGSGKPAAARVTPAANPHDISAVDLYQLAAEMRAGKTALAIRCRSYLFTDYPSCFVGSEAVDWIVQHKAFKRPQAVKLGERMFESGLFHHVTDEHDFKDGNFFFRFFADDLHPALPAAKRHAPDIDTLNIEKLAQRMRGAGGVEVASRRYLLSLYPKCFTGREAVDWLAKHCRLSRPMALKAGERMIATGLIHHVTDGHRFEDAELFYRFYADE